MTKTPHTGFRLEASTLQLLDALAQYLGLATRTAVVRWLIKDASRRMAAERKEGVDTGRP